jgi:two-component system, OmpR family, sensor histidine kinase KdpD
MRKSLVGSAIGVALAIALGAALVPARSHLPLGAPGLVLVVPVVAGVITGGLRSGLVSVLAGFAVFDFLFVPPYGSFTVGTYEDWLTLGVFVVVMALVARVVAGLDEARRASAMREANAQHLLELSELLLGDKSMNDLGRMVVDWARAALALDGAALLLPSGGHLEVAASSGTPISPDELRRLRPEAHVPVALSTSTSGDTLQALALASSGRPVGLLVMRNVPQNATVREVLPILANHLAIALERTDLRERVIHAELLEEVDRLRRSLIGAVSHDLRTPLATIKVASSTFLDKTNELTEQDADELHALIDMQADRLTRLVSSLLDMTRIQSGSLEVRPRPRNLIALIDEALAELHSSFLTRPVDVDVPEDLRCVYADPLLIVQVLANLLDNANRHSPPGTSISVRSQRANDGRVAVSVTDHGPGVPAQERQAIFERFVRFDTGGRSGLGLAIAKAFVEAHGDRIWVEEAPGGGARFVFTLPLAPTGREAA